jgi:hypothetical protein
MKASFRVKVLSWKYSDTTYTVKASFFDPLGTPSSMLKNCPRPIPNIVKIQEDIAVKI